MTHFPRSFKLHKHEDETTGSHQLLPRNAQSGFYMVTADLLYLASRILPKSGRYCHTPENLGMYRNRRGTANRTWLDGIGGFCHELLVTRKQKSNASYKGLVVCFKS
jgi:hypothetical protein